MVRQEVIDKTRELQHQPAQIRNISVIAHVDHGKSTLTDSLVSAAGLLSKDKAGDALMMDSMKEEKERGITIKASGISLPFDIVEDDPNPNYNPNWPNPPPPSYADDDKDDDNKADTKSAEKKQKVVSYLVNLIDSPGHVDFSPEVTAALRVTDGALVVVDCVEGVCVQTKTVLRQALTERIKPVLFLNKMDRIFFELKMEPEEAYQTLARAVESVNVVIATYLDEEIGDLTVWPQNGTVAFGSGLHGWGFTLKDFAKLWHNQFDMPVKKMTKKLWGDWFFDPKLKKFVPNQFTDSGKKLKRAFCQFVLEPLQLLFEATLTDNTEQCAKIFTKFNITKPVSKDRDDPLVGKKLYKAVMRDWLPAATAVLDMVVHKLPSPLVAQKYRVDKLYSGPLDDEVATAIRNCDPNGPLMMYVSKMVPTADYSRFYAFGRIFSGSVRTGQVIRIQGPNFVPGDDKSSDLYVKPVQGTYLMMGPSVESIGSCPCGNTVGLMGIDQYLTKCGTITTFPQAHNFVSMKHSVSPIVRLAVEAANPAQLGKLVQGLKKLVKIDPMVQVSMAETGEYIVAGCGELHLQVCLNTLRNDLMKDVALRVSEPVVSYCESIETTCHTTVCTKSPNKLNRLFLTASPLGEDLCTAIDNGVITGEMEGKARAKLLCDEFKWDLSEARKIWCFGAPPSGQANVLVDLTKGVQYLHDIKESVIGAFRQQTNAGVYCGEPLRGVRFNITDAKIHPDPPHHGAGQIMPCTRQGLFAAQIGSGPCLLEPMFLCEVNVPQTALQGVYQTLRQRRGVIDGAHDTGVGAVSVVKAFVPVKESFGFTESLRQNTSGQAFPTLTFSHWQRMPGELDDVNSLAHETVVQIRARKGMSPQLPQFTDYHQRL